MGPQEHKVEVVFSTRIARVVGDIQLTRKLDEWTSTGWEIVSIMLEGKSAAQASMFIVVTRKPIG